MIYLILALAAFLRLWQLDSLPISLFGDEIDVGYHAWSLWTTGRDYLGHLFPTYIQSLAEWRAPLLMYVTAPFVGLLGPSALSVRLPAALLGISNIYLIYLLGRRTVLNVSEATDKRTVLIGLLSALILAVTPWHIHYSRAAFEATLLLTLLLLGTYLFIRRHPLFPLPFILTFYTYSTANLFTPLLVLALYLIYRPKLKKLHLLYLLLLLPIGYHLFFGQAAGRFSGISVFKDPKLVEDIIIQRTQPWVEQGREAIFHNKAIAYAAAIGHQYLEAFSPQFLFITGDPFLRHSVDRFGQLLWVTAPFLGLGLFLALSQIRRSPAAQLLLVWLFLSPLSSALTQSGGLHATRLFIMLPPLIILTALGLERTVLNVSAAKYKRTVLYGSGLVLLVTVNLIGYWHQYSSHYRYLSFQYWHSGYQDIFTQLKPHLDSAPRVYINNTHEPSLLRFAFFTQLPPKDFQKSFTSDAPRDNLLPGFNGFRFGDKYFFGQIQDGVSIAEFLKPYEIYLAAQGKEVPGDWDWSKSPPAGLKSLGITRNVYSDSLFHLVAKLD